MTILTPDPLTEVFDFEDEQAASPEREAYLRDLRELVASAGHPFIKVTFHPIEEGADSGQASFQVQGIDPAAVPQTLRELADLLEDQVVGE